MNEWFARFIRAREGAAPDSFTPDSLRLDVEVQAEPGAGLLRGGEPAAPLPTSDTPALISAARSLLERIFRPGFVYHKAGIFLTDIVPEAERQRSVLARMDGERRMSLMRAVDGINRRHGHYTVRPLSLGTDKGWEMRRRNLSPRYTTRVDEVLKVKAC